MYNTLHIIYITPPFWAKLIKKMSSLEELKVDWYTQMKWLIDESIYLYNVMLFVSFLPDPPHAITRMYCYDFWFKLCICHMYCVILTKSTMDVNLAQLYSSPVSF